MDYDEELSSDGVLRALVPNTNPDHSWKLGRHVEHDPQSWGFPAPRATTRVSVRHQRTGGPFDQGNLGSCTGNAAGGLLMTAPLAKPSRVVDEAMCVMFYEMATRLDGYSGTYPPSDTGSSGLAVCKGLKNAGLIRSYSHAMGIDHALDALVLGAVITGVPWLTGFDSPDGNGLVHAIGSVRGGHEFVVDEIIVERELVGATNSWGTAFGVGGRFYFSWADWALLLGQQGDVTQVA